MLSTIKIKIEEIYLECIRLSRRTQAALQSQRQ